MRPWPRRARRLLRDVPEGVPRTLVLPSDDVPAVLTRTYAAAVRDVERTHVVQLTAPAACDLGIELVVAAEIAGDALIHRDVTPDAPPPEPDALSGRALPSGARPAGELISLRRPVVDGRAVAVLRSAAAAVLVVDTAHASSSSVAAAVDMLGGLGVDLRGLVVWLGRIPPDPGWRLPAPARAAPPALCPGPSTVELPALGVPVAPAVLDGHAPRVPQPRRRATRPQAPPP